MYRPRMKHVILQ